MGGAQQNQLRIAACAAPWQRLCVEIGGIWGTLVPSLFGKNIIHLWGRAWVHEARVGLATSKTHSLNNIVGK